MTATRPPRARPRQARRTGDTWRQPSQCPRRWGRPLAVGLTLALVAALVPRAGADESAMPAEPGFTETDMLPATVEAAGLPEAYDAPDEAAVTDEQNEQPSRESGVVADLRPERQQPGDQHDTKAAGGSANTDIRATPPRDDGHHGKQ